jgi:hypothetical protein
MSNDKQTAVDWLLDRIEDVDLTEKLWENIKHQAKEMEKEQIKNAWYDGYLYEGRMPDNECVADTYYKKTYGGNK